MFLTHAFIWKPILFLRLPPTGRLSTIFNYFLVFTTVGLVFMEKKDDTWNDEYPINVTQGQNEVSRFILKVFLEIVF